MKLQCRRAAITAQALAGYGIDAFIGRFEPNEDLTKARQLWSCKDSSRPFGLYPFPRTHRRHMVDILQRFNIDCVLNVGAHDGEFGQLLLDLRFQGHILSFEPVSASFKRLETASKGDPKWRIFPFALGSSDTESQIHLYRSSDFNSLPTPAGVHDRLEWCTEELGIETIAVRRLESVYEMCTAGISLPRVYLKMDTQGYDVEVIR